MFEYRLTNQKQEGVDGDAAQTGSLGGQTEASHSQQQHTQFLGDASHALPSFGNVIISSVPLPEGVDADDIHTFEKIYREHAEVGLA